MNHNSPNNYMNAIAARAHAIAAKAAGVFRKADDGPVHLGSTDTFQHFRSISASELMSGNYTRPVTVTDIETGHNDQVISVSALKGVIDKRTGEFRVVDVYERYYTPDKPYSASFNMSREVHKLTPDKINDLRRVQGTTYSEKYDENEARSLMQFARGSLVVGHNVEQFDFERLGVASALQHEDILDTQVWAENIGVRVGHRGLSKLFKAYTGRTLKQAGYSHHFGFHDVLSTAELFSAIYRQKGKGGRDVRFVTNNKGYSYGAYEDVAGTAIIKGGYYKGRGHGGPQNYMYEDEFDDSEIFAQEFDKQGFPLEWEYDENGQKKLPQGFNWSDELIESGDATGGYGTLMSVQLAEQYRAMTQALEKTREATIGFKVHQQNQMIRYLANKDEDVGRAYLKGLKYDKATIDLMMKQAMPLRIAKAREQSWKKAQSAHDQSQKVESYLNHLFRKGEIGRNDWQWLSDVNNESSGFSPRDIMYMAKERQSEHKERLKRGREKVQERENAEFGYWRSVARDLNEDDAWSFDRGEALQKIKYLDKAQKRGDITAKQRASLDGLVGSYDELVDATNDMIEANRKLEKTYRAIASIKPYDINNLIGAVHGQWSGITGAARGVVPNFVLNPLTRLGNAALNSIDRSVAPWNAFNRTFNAVVGPFMGGGGGSGLGGGGIGGASKFGVGMGIFNGITQGVGNYAQAKVEMKGLEIQNTLNTLGAMVSWISTPFSLLHKAAKLLIGSFTGLSFKLNNFMANGIGLMSQMGNPLTELTGMNYNAYAGSTMMDVASLFGKGSMNSVYEDFASQQQGLLFGNINTQRMIAASMLGGFEDVYMSRGDSMTDYNTFANKILANMKGQNALQQRQTMYLAGQIDKNLPSLLRTANLLGVSDVNQLADPTKSGVYWNAIDDTDRTRDKNGLTEAGRFRWTQYEFGAAREQMGYSKMRLANSLWRAGGKQIYNAFNELVDAAATGNWETAIDKATEMWKTFKEKVTGVWEAIRTSLGGDGEGGGESKLVGTFKTIGSLITNVAIDVALKILDIWGDITNKLAEKAQGLVAYLSTVSLKPHWDWKNGLSFSMESIDTANTPKGSTPIFKSVQGYMMPWDDHTKGYAALTEALFPDMSDEEKRKLTRDKLVDKLHHLPGVIKDGVLDTPELNLPEYFISGLNLGHNPELIEPLMDLLGKADSKGPGFRLAAAAYSSELRPYISNEIYDSTGIGNAVKEFNDFTFDTTRTTLQGLYNDNVARIELMFKDDSGKKALIAADSKGNVLSKNLTLLSQMVPEGLKLVVNQLR